MSVTFALVVGASTVVGVLALLIAREAKSPWPRALLISGGALLGALTAFAALVPTLT